MAKGHPAARIRFEGMPVRAVPRLVINYAGMLVNNVIPATPAGYFALQGLCTLLLHGALSRTISSAVD